jgi:hypothetical protein
MNLIFYGFLVMLLGIDVSGISLAPLFQIGGYALVMQGMQAVDKENTYFKRALPLIYALMALNAATFLMDVANIAALGGIIGIATGVIGLITVYNVLKGIQVYRDELQTPNLTTKMYKRWRLSVILFIVGFVAVIVAMIALITAVPFTAFMELFTEFQANPTSEALAYEIGQLVAPIVGVFFGLMMVFLITIVTAMVFYIMFLVSLYNVQKEFALRTPAISAPTDFPNPQ